VIIIRRCVGVVIYGTIGLLLAGRALELWYRKGPVPNIIYPFWPISAFYGLTGFQEFTWWKDKRTIMFVGTLFWPAIIVLNILLLSILSIGVLFRNFFWL